MIIVYKKKSLLFTFACVVVMLSGFWLASRWSARLLVVSRAVHSTPTAGWALNAVAYQWGSDHDVWYLKRMPSGQPDDYVLSCFDFGKTKESTSSLPFWAHTEAGRPTSLQVSPDRRWLLWNASSGEFITDIRGKDVFKWDDNSEEYIWSDNSRQVVTLVSESPGCAVRFRCPFKKDVGTKLWLSAKAASMARQRTIVSVSNNHRLVLSYWEGSLGAWMHEGKFYQPGFHEQRPTGKAESSVQIEEVDLHHPGDLPEEFVLHPPLGGQLEDVCISPDGNRVAWELMFVHAPRLDTFLHSIITPWPVSQTIEHAIWVSNVNGDNMHEICREPMKKMPNRSVPTMRIGNSYPIFVRASDKQRYQPDNLRWLPNGKQVSILYEDRLWILPAD